MRVSGQLAWPEGVRVGTRSHVMGRCWTNRRLRRALAAYLLFNMVEWATWIALLVWGYDERGPAIGDAVRPLVRVLFDQEGRRRYGVKFAQG